VKTQRQIKYLQIIDAEHWPDSIEETVNVVYYNGEPVEYIETPICTTKNMNIEYDNYFYKKRSLAYRGFSILNENVCGKGSVSKTTVIYFDSLGTVLKTMNSLVDANNIPIDSTACPVKLNYSNHIYRSYSQTPLAKEGIEGIYKPGK
jgi:hypothetical protein